MGCILACSCEDEKEANVHSCKPICNPNIYVSWSTSELRVRFAPSNRVKPSSKIFYWPFQGVLLMLIFFLSCVWYAFVRVCLYVPCGHLLGKGWPLGSHLWCLNVSLSLSHWYLGSGVVLDCIDSWSLHPYLLCVDVYQPSQQHFSYLTVSQRRWHKRKATSIDVFCTKCPHSWKPLA